MTSFLVVLVWWAAACDSAAGSGEDPGDVSVDGPSDVEGSDSADSLDAFDPPDFELPPSRELTVCAAVDWEGAICSGTVGAGSCETDSDCEGSEICRPEIVELRDSVCGCGVPGCVDDGDCGVGEACACSDYSPLNDRWCGGGSDVRCAGQCLPADCRTADDCDTGEICASYSGVCGQLQGWACRAEVEPGCASHPACSFDQDSLAEPHVLVCTYCAATSDCDQYLPRADGNLFTGWRCDVRPEIPICD